MCKKLLNKNTSQGVIKRLLFPTYSFHEKKNVLPYFIIVAVNYVAYILSLFTMMTLIVKMRSKKELATPIQIIPEQVFCCAW